MIWVTRLISFAVVLQTLELFKVAPWPMRILEDEIPRPLRALVRAYPAWLWLRLFAAMITLFVVNPFALAVQLLATWLIALRWRGTFNGGSDLMTFQILATCLVSSIFSTAPRVQTACLLYISLQLVLSYFVAGLAKLRQASWRNGTALPRFLNMHDGRKMRGRSWGVILFECLFPMSLISPRAAVLFIGVGLVFHLMNFYYFGLNRFLFAWLAAYPAIFFLR